MNSSVPMRPAVPVNLAVSMGAAEPMDTCGQIDTAVPVSAVVGTWGRPAADEFPADRRTRAR
ncbi:hypothetical protein IU449_17225 [Nocardia higoensis]|uniref:Uncharacterized protein n=1 Tax=Nocardia higoensis TaxID=228599 RepID=A0ABS0DH44_9NOCA|nr:hypothetical protein [Nocardia higoensis]MBF6356264.1 hypothetical protein [Nocardia higoensis]